MLLLLCAVKDTKTALFDPPFTCRHTNEALREWGIVTKDRNTKFGKNPEDFQLFEIGTYDDELGEVTSHQKHKHLANGV